MNLLEKEQQLLAIVTYPLSISPAHLDETVFKKAFSPCMYGSQFYISDASCSYVEIKNCLRELTGKVIWLVEDCTETAMPWIQSPTINRKQERVTVWISPDILRYARQCEEIYPGDYGDLPAIKSQYSTRLLLLLHDRESPVRFRVDELKAQLLTQDLKSYDNNFKNFRRAVLEPAIKEINGLGNCTITMKTEYEGKKIGSVVFYIEEAQRCSQAPDESPEEIRSTPHPLFVPIPAEDLDVK